MIDEYFDMAFRSLKRRGLRSWLTLLGIFIGIAAVVALISLGQGLEQSVVGEVEELGGDTLFVQAESELGSTGEGSTATPVTIDDVDFLKRQAGVLSVTYFASTSARVQFRDTVRFPLIVGVPTNPPERFSGYFDMWSYPIIEGRQLRSNDRFTATLGYQHGFRNIWNGQNIPIGAKFSINNKSFRSAGIYEASGSGTDDRVITITDSAYEDLFGDIQRVDMIIVTVTNEDNIEAIASDLRRSLARFRDNEEDFTIETPLDLLSSFRTILDIVQSVLIGIAGVSLFVGGVGIMNTMYTAVLERKKDIGIMKAIGARNRDIFLQFFIESGLLGLVGGILGVAFGAAMAYLVEVISTAALGTSFLQAFFSWQLFVGSILFSFIVGALAGTLPAWQASKQQAADTLRDE